MNTISLYNRLLADGALSAEGKYLQLSVSYLDGLATGQFGVTQVSKVVCSYFPEGKVLITELQPFGEPPEGKRITLSGAGAVPPFTGMAVGLEIWSAEKSTGVFELHVMVKAYGTTGIIWAIAAGFPLYQGTLLGDIRFAPYGDPAVPMLTLSSHEIPAEGILSGMFCKGLLEADSLQGANMRLFLGDEAAGKYVVVFGTIAVPPLENPRQKVIHPYVSLFSGLPERGEDWKLGKLFSVEKIRCILKGEPRYNTATREWEPSCVLVWMADLVISPSVSSVGTAQGRYKIPVGIEIYQQDGAIRAWSDLNDGLSLAWDLLAGSIPGTTFRIPTTDFRLQDIVKLTELELLAEHNERGELEVEWVSLKVETNEEKNRWVLIDRLLVLDAIDFHILVRNPHTAPQVNFTLSGLFGIGKEGVLRLSTSFESTDGSTDFIFGGQLIGDDKINIKEILTHFLGRSQHPELPEMEVRDFSFSVQPKSKIYEGEILLDGDWGIPGLTAFSLRDVFFRLRRAGEGDTEFEAVGVFELGGAPLFVLANYISDGQGWTFAGGTYEQGKIPIGQWLLDIGKLLGLQTTPSPPASLENLELSDLGVRFNTATKDFSFHGTAAFRIDPKVDSACAPKLTVQADLKKQSQAGSHAVTFTGALHLGARDFSIGYGSHGKTSLLVAAYDSPKGDSIEVKELVGHISTELAGAVPPGLKISLQHVQLAIATGDVNRFLFGIELDAGIELSKLPLVGSAFDRSQTLSVAFQLLALNETFSKEDVREINRLTAAGVTKLAEREINTDKGKVQIKANVRLGGISQELDFPLKHTVSTTETQTTLSIKADDSEKQSLVSGAGDPKKQRLIKWVNVQKTFGPVHFQRVGIGLEGSDAEFLLDASLEMAGLTITLEGLAAKCALKELSDGKFHPTFQLDGLGVDFKRGALEIGGALLRSGEDQYDGALTIRYKQLGIQALGSYRKVDQQPSLFVYALINYPIGGPPFFYVEGLALGFGYNRKLKMPTIDTVSLFPLVQQALPSANKSVTPMGVVEQLNEGRHLEPAVGEYFFAVGVRFSSFKNIQGFALLAVLFGQHFEIDVLGKATLVTPPGEAKPLVSASLALLARFSPDDGILTVMAKLLPDAYVFSKDCHLTGGFAFCCWFGKEHNGDFVLTLGGYGKFFNPPSHYPQVPRLAINWQVDANLKVNADAYFALTPGALMIGGHLGVVWQSGNLKAWFNASVDFLIGWRPFHYEGEISVSLGASYSFKFFGWRTVSVELAADLQIWGPPFSGIAHVHWFIISFDVAFGEPRKPIPQMREWEEFQKSFLPKTEGICTIAAQAGKVTPHGSKAEEKTDDAQAKAKPNANRREHLGVLNPRELSIVVNSAIPITKPLGALLTRAAEPQVKFIAPALGIAPMGKKQGQWKSEFTVTIRHNNADVSDKFRATAIRQAVPAALWGEEIDPKDRKAQLLGYARCGYEIQPAAAIKPPQSSALPAREVKLHNLEPLRPLGGKLLVVAAGQEKDEACGKIKETVQAPEEKDQVRTRIKETVQTPDVREKRQAILQDLLPAAEIDWTGVTVESWRATPTLVEFN